ncbi:hypothetical protein CIL06_03955 [Pantoea vagans]|uniref:hypothetical protein n=1 Tax=Pantoea vagans TaxID=470934 RepID=UPI000BACE2C7|nr:hypothetical protein [Pantoea vagans]PAW34909.1 hypothetical protein CIL06_03955 [Pantoea vagans]
MNREMAIERSIFNYIKDTHYIGSRDDLNIDAKWHPRFFKKCYYIIQVEGVINNNLIKKEYQVIANESLFQSKHFLLFMSVYLLLAIAFIVGYLKNNHYLELAYFSPILLGYFYFKMTHKHLGPLLKKQADTISFFLSMLTACYLQVKVMGLSLTFFPIFGKPVSDFFICLTLHLLCIFISIKFYISILDLLESSKQKGGFLKWIERLLT